MSRPYAIVGFLALCAAWPAWSQSRGRAFARSGDRSRDHSLRERKSRNPSLLFRLALVARWRPVAVLSVRQRSPETLGDGPLSGSALVDGRRWRRAPPDHRLAAGAPSRRRESALGAERGFRLPAVKGSEPSVYGASAGGRWGGRVHGHTRPVQSAQPGWEATVLRHRRRARPLRLE